MPFTPPDLGRVLEILDTVRAQLGELEQVADGAGDKLAVAELAGVRGVLERIERRVRERLPNSES